MKASVLNLSERAIQAAGILGFSAYTVYDTYATYAASPPEDAAQMMWRFVSATAAALLLICIATWRVRPRLAVWLFWRRLSQKKFDLAIRQVSQQFLDERGGKESFCSGFANTQSIEVLHTVIWQLSITRATVVVFYVDSVRTRELNGAPNIGSMPLTSASTTIEAIVATLDNDPASSRVRTAHLAAPNFGDILEWAAPHAKHLLAADRVAVQFPVLKVMTLQKKWFPFSRYSIVASATPDQHSWIGS